MRPDVNSNSCGLLRMRPDVHSQLNSEPRALCPSENTQQVVKDQASKEAGMEAGRRRGEGPGAFLAVFPTTVIAVATRLTTLN